MESSTPKIPILLFTILIVSLFSSALDDEQQYFTDILLAIKQVMNTHLQEMQDKFHHRFERLEDEIKNKEKIINRLRAHIFELERNREESFRVGVNHSHSLYKDNMQGENKKLHRNKP